MQGYFDIHCHILPGVDDGAKDMEETRRMLLIAHEEGIRIVVATPHYRAGNRNVEIENLKAIYLEVNQLAESALKEFHIVLGNELFYSPEVINALKRGDALTIDDTRYILVEFLSNAEYREIRDGLNHCIYSGYIPILAHTERYQCLNNDYELIGNLIELGVYIQINLSSILKKQHNTKKKMCNKLIRKGWVHFLGTDAHGAYDRAPRATEVATYLSKKYGDKIAKQLLWDNPMTMLENEHL